MQKRIISFCAALVLALSLCQAACADETVSHDYTQGDSATVTQTITVTKQGPTWTLEVPATQTLVGGGTTALDNVEIKNVQNLGDSQSIWAFISGDGTKLTSTSTSSEIEYSIVVYKPNSSDVELGWNPWQSDNISRKQGIARYRNGSTEFHPVKITMDEVDWNSADPGTYTSHLVYSSSVMNNE